MKKLIVSFSLLFLCTLLLSGCDLAQPKNKGQEQPVTPAADPQQQQAEVPAAPPQVDVPTQDDDNTVMVRAETGVGARGQTLSPVTANNPVDIITAPLSAMFRTEQRLVFQQITAAENLFRGEHDRLPNSHEEFMREIIQRNNIQLPRLPSGQEYFYDAPAGELKVKRPR